jgi:hypothetical protein
MPCPDLPLPNHPSFPPSPSFISAIAYLLAELILLHTNLLYLQASVVLGVLYIIWIVVHHL